MNWIDDKYKEKLGNKKFPDNLKKAGWERAQLLLDNEMPTRGGLISRRLGFYLILGLVIISVPFIWWNSTQQSSVPAINTPVIESINNDKGGLVNDDTKEGIDVNSKENNDESIKSGQYNNKYQSNLNEGNTITSSQIEEQEATQVTTNEDQRIIKETSSTFLTEANEGNIEEQQHVVSELTGEVSDLKDDPISNDLKTDNPEQLNHKDQASNAIKNEMSSFANNNEDLVNTNDPESTIKNQKNDPTKGPGNKGKPEELDETLEGSNEPKANESGNEPDQKLDGLESNTGSPTETLNDVGSDELNDPSNSLTNDGNEQSGEKGLDEENPAPVAKVSTKRKSHFAFLEKGDEDLIGGGSGYQLFSRERFSISLWGGYSYTDKFLSASNKSYLNTRQNEEDVIYTTPTGFNLDYFVDNNWTFGTGISWTEYGENLNYDLSSIDTSIVNGRGELPTSFDNVVYIDSVRVIDSIFSGYWQYTLATKTGDSIAQANNGRTSWQYIEIPFTLGYRFGEGRVKPWIKTGVSIGVPIRTNFRYINPQATELNDLSLNDKLVAPLQYNYLLSIGVDCYLSRSISMRLNAVSSFQLNSSLQQEAIRQRYYRLGVTLGLAYNF